MSPTESIADTFCPTAQLPSLRIELQRGTDLRRWRDIIAKDRLMADLDVCIHESFAEVPQQEVYDFFKHLGFVTTHLRRIEMYPGEGNYNAFPVHALASTVLQARSLESLYVYHLGLSGDPDHFIDFASNLEDHPCLKEFCFIDCELCEENTAFNIFDPVVRVLGNMPNLEVVALWATDERSLGRLTSETLVSLCLSKSIERLMLLRFDICDHDVAGIFEAIGQNNVMKRLNISCEFGHYGCVAISKMLQNSTTMEKIKLEVDKWENEEPYQLMRLAEGLKMNEAITYFKLSGPGVGSRIHQEVFVDVMEHNYTLQTFHVFNLWDPKIDFFLKLNRAGKRRLLRDPKATIQDLVEALISMRDDVQCLFYFVSTNPTLFVSGQ